MNNWLKRLLALLLIASLSACGSDLSGGEEAPADGGTGGGTDSDVPVVYIGNISSGSFAQGVIAIATTSIPARGSTSLYVDLQDENGDLYVTPAEVIFTTTCANQGLASIDSPVSTQSGRATATYSAEGCVGDDIITATVVTEAGTESATGTVTIAAVGMGSIEFIGVSPEYITLKGTGGQGRTEFAEVRFRAVDVNGYPINSRDFTFSLWPQIGGDSRGPTLTDTTGTTDANGEVVAYVQSGTVPAAISVLATDNNTGLSTISSTLIVSTGIPDQDSFEIGADILNPRAWNFTGETVIISAYLGDRANHPVPDGTAVLFTTEGGKIEPSCLTVNGACSVTWTGQYPRPCGQTLGANTVSTNISGTNTCVSAGTTINPSEPQAGIAPLGQPYGGRVTITAMVVGEESFDDVDDDFVYDAGEQFDDLAEPFLDVNEDGVYDAKEQHFELDSDAVRDLGDGSFTGVVCTASGCNMDVLYISSSVVLVMSGDDASIWLSLDEVLADTVTDATTALTAAQTADTNAQSAETSAQLAVDGDATADALETTLDTALAAYLADLTDTVKAEAYQAALSACQANTLCNDLLDATTAAEEAAAALTDAEGIHASALQAQVDGVIDLGVQPSYFISYRVSDLHNQTLPAGTTISIASTHGTVESDSITIGSTNENAAIEGFFIIEGNDPEEYSTGWITMTVSVPGDQVVKHYIAEVREPASQ